MKNYIIKINDISEIDTSKITVYDLKNRYIDKNGNIYGIKFDNRTKKIEIIKLLRTHSSQVHLLNKQLIKKKQEETAKKEQKEQEKIEEDNFEDEVKEEEEQLVSLEGFNPEKLVEETIETMAIHKQRLNAIIMNLKKSKYINEDNKTDNIGLDDYFRTIDIEGIQKIEKILNYQSEFINYPRSISYYQSRLDKRGRDILEKIIADKDKAINFIYLYEMCYSIRNVYRQIRRILENLYKFLTNIDEAHLSSPLHIGHQQFEDASTSLKNTIQECDLILDDFFKLETYLHNFE